MTTTTDPSATDPTVAVVAKPSDDEHARERAHWTRENIETCQKTLARRIPARYANAVATNDAVKDWVCELVAESVPKHPLGRPNIASGPSLLILGPTGTGKTFEAWGAIRALSASGALVLWQFVTAADLYAKLRPRHGIDSEAEFEIYAKTHVLVLDDLGAAKPSEWVEEVNYRLINYRYEQGLPTLCTSNVPVKQLAEHLGDRVTSRLTEMAQRVALEGGDRRRARGVQVVREPERPPAERKLDGWWEN